MYRYADPEHERIVGPDGIAFSVDPNDPCQSADSCLRFPQPDGTEKVVETEAYRRSQTFQSWMADGHAPEPYVEPEADRRARERARLLARLDVLDQAAIRPLSALQNGTATDEDGIILDAIEWEKSQLRAELEALKAPPSEPAAPAAAEVPAVAEDQPYRLTSGKYHTATCGYAKTAAPATRDEVMASGNAPCTRCNPTL